MEDMLIPKLGKFVHENTIILYLFLINNGINIEKVKDNITLLKSIDNFI